MARPVRAAAADRARAADPDRDPDQSDRALRDRRQRLRLGRDHRPQHLPADLSAGRDGPVADQRGPEPDHASWSRSTPAPGSPARCSAACGTTSSCRWSGSCCRSAAVATLAWRADRMTPLSFELLVIADRDRLRAAAVADLGGDAERGGAAPARHLGRHHELSCRNLYATMLIAVFGAIVLAGAPASAAGRTPTPSAASSWLAAASLAVALVAMLLMEQKPLQSERRDGCAALVRSRTGYATLRSGASTSARPAPRSRR